MEKFYADLKSVYQEYQGRNEEGSEIPNYFFSLHY